MSGYPYRLQLGWMTLLALVWLGACSPWLPFWKLLSASLVVVAAFGGVLMVTRRLRSRQKATAQVLSAADGLFNALPADLKRNTPLIIAVGEPTSLACAFGDDAVRITDSAAWVRCDSPDSLVQYADALRHWRNGQQPDAVVLLVGADEEDAGLPFGAALRRWRSAIGAAERMIGGTLPVGVAAYAATGGGSQEPCPWFGISGVRKVTSNALAEALVERLGRYAVGGSSTAMSVTRTQHAGVLAALVEWASHAILPLLVDSRQDSSPLSIMAFGVIAVPGLPMAGAPFSNFVADTTGLVRRCSKGSLLRSVPLPNALLRGIPRQPRAALLPRALAHAWLGLAVFISAGMVGSAWQNQVLIKRMTANAMHFKLLPEERDTERFMALSQIKRDRNELERYEISGVPMRLGFGLYRGASWLPDLDRLIASYRPPMPLVTIDLDDLSLFKSGSAMLDANSNRVLVKALDIIKAHPGKRVLISGHTDNVGNARTNLQLSTARAEAVRDWLVDASDMSPTRFAIQGYGDTRPKVSNDTADGRAANRRVEITLIPDCRRDGGDHFNKVRAACS